MVEFGAEEIARGRDQLLTAEIRCESADVLKVKGKKGFLSKTFEWKRVPAGEIVATEPRP